MQPPAPARVSVRMRRRRATRRRGRRMVAVLHTALGTLDAERAADQATGTLDTVARESHAWRRIVRIIRDAAAPARGSEVAKASAAVQDWHDNVSPDTR